MGESLPQYRSNSSCRRGQLFGYGWTLDAWIGVGVCVGACVRACARACARACVGAFTTGRACRLAPILLPSRPQTYKRTRVTE